MLSKRLNILAIVIFIAMAAYLYLQQEQLLHLLDQFHQANYSFGKKLSYYTLFILFAVFVPIPLGGISRLLAGILFGFEMGFILSILIMNSLALVQVYFFRTYIDLFKIKIDQQKMKFIQERVLKDGFEAVIWLRVIFLFPYQITNMTLSFTKLKYRHFFFGSLLGEVPVTLFYTFIGQTLQSLKDLSVIKEKFWILVALASVYSVIILIVKYRKKILMKRFRL